MKNELLFVGILGAALSVLFICSMTVGVSPALFYSGAVVSGLFILGVLIRKRNKKLSFISLIGFTAAFYHFYNLDIDMFHVNLISLGGDNTLELSISYGVLACVPWITPLSIIMKNEKK